MIGYFRVCRRPEKIGRRYIQFEYARVFECLCCGGRWQTESLGYSKEGWNITQKILQLRDYRNPGIIPVVLTLLPCFTARRIRVGITLTGRLTADPCSDKHPRAGRIILPYE